MEYTQDAQNGLIVWGNSLTEPKLNYSTENYQARDGADFTFAQDDETFHAHTGTTTLSDLDTNQVVTHYRMTCSIGATILTIPTVTASVEVAKLRRGQPDNPLNLELIAAPKPISRNLYFQLQIGILDSE